MPCPRCKSTMITRGLSDKTSRQECTNSECGYSQIVENTDGQQSDRRLLLDTLDPTERLRPLQG